MLNRRKYSRLPVIKNVAKELFVSTDKGFFQGLIINLSAGGLLLLMYSDLPVGSPVCLLFDYPPLETEPIFGEVIRSTKTKALIREVAIKFTEISTIDSKKINRLAIDYTDCENKITLGALDVCRKECSYYNFCEKKLKIK
ncbi:MAG: PilZ domain-containing protein [Endomicrobiaceae bacterium]|nr:PilZ domain-containing protein [Endomicrobiaceae bacterium]